METKFTHGPWEFYGTTTPHVTSDYAGEGDIADLYHKTINGQIFIKDNAEANGHLIAAAPELYEALDLLTSLVEVVDGNKHMKIIIQAKAALAKARGEQ